MTKCVIWAGHINKHLGYGVAFDHGRPMYAHRLAYMTAKGDIPEGYVVHHICHTRACVNPAHLEILPRAEHPTHHLQEFCDRGHPLVVGNLYIRPDTGGRTCLQCSRDRNRAYRASHLDDLQRKGRERERARRQRKHEEALANARQA